MCPVVISVSWLPFSHYGKEKCKVWTEDSQMMLSDPLGQSRYKIRGTTCRHLFLKVKLTAPPSSVLMQCLPLLAFCAQ